MDSTTLLGIGFLVLGALVTLAEIHTLTVYLLALAAGLFAAGASALAGGSLTANLAILAVVVVLGLPLAHWWRGKLKNREADDLARDDVGNRVTVVSATGPVLRVSYRGSTWDARLEDAIGAAPAAGHSYIITRREGNLLILAP